VSSSAPERRLSWPPQWKRESGCLVAAGVLTPLLVVMQPSQPIRAVAAASLLLLLPGLAVARVVNLGDAIMLPFVAVSVSLALTVLTSTGLMYAGIWSWQLTLLVLGVITAAVGALTALMDVRS
jgi:hypothetical protein